MEDNEDMLYTVCSAIAYHLTVVTTEEVLAMFERYGSMDVTLTILNIMESRKVSREQAEQRLNAVIESSTQCFGFIDGRVGLRSRDTCYAFDRGIPWDEFIKPSAFLRRKRETPVKHEKIEEFLND